MKHKIDGALNQNTNSNHNFKTNQIRTKKKKKSKANPSEPRWEEDIVVLLECSGVDVVLEKKRKKKSEDKRIEFQTKCYR